MYGFSNGSLKRLRLSLYCRREGEDWVIAWSGNAREESPDFMGRALGNSQAERSDTSTTENRPPMAKTTGFSSRRGLGKGETVG